MNTDPSSNTPAMKMLEKEGEIKVAQLLQQLSTLPDCPAKEEERANRCLQIIQEGGKTFEKITGKPMSYSEMRSMYG